MFSFTLREFDILVVNSSEPIELDDTGEALKPKGSGQVKRKATVGQDDEKFSKKIYSDTAKPDVRYYNKTPTATNSKKQHPNRNPNWNPTWLPGAYDIRIRETQSINKMPTLTYTPKDHGPFVVVAKGQGETAER